MNQGMSRMWLAATLSLTLPTVAEACQGLRTYDFGNPTAHENDTGILYRYFIARVASIDAEQDAKNGFSARVHFEILTDYRYKNQKTLLTAFVKRHSCIGLPTVGTVGKFAIDERSGLPVLAHTRFSF